MVHYSSASASHSILVNATRLLAWPLEVRYARAPGCSAVERSSNKEHLLLKSISAQGNGDHLAMNII